MIPRVLLGELVVAGLVALLPGQAVVVAGVGLVLVGFLSEQGHDREAHRRVARWVAVVNAPVLAGLWLLASATDPEIAASSWGQRAVLATLLGSAFGLATGGLVLLGLDARAHTR
ncbi:MAG: hypothetical protein KC656_22100 [Myxococcales bacterium]|nr:hypothetical protein [Myxococcales bacterium]